MIMEENTQLPKEVVREINEQADKYGFVVPYNGSNKFYNDDKLEGYKAGATTYAIKLHQANETIKVLTYDNNRLKGEVEGLKSAGDEASGYIEFLDVQNNRLRKMLSDICEKAGAGTEIEKMIVEFFKEINTERESAAGREEANRCPVYVPCTEDDPDCCGGYTSNDGRSLCYVKEVLVPLSAFKKKEK